VLLALANAGKDDELSSANSSGTTGQKLSRKQPGNKKVAATTTTSSIDKVWH